MHFRRTLHVSLRSAKRPSAELENRKIKNPQTHPGNTSDSRSGIRGGGFDQLLEHRFKPKPVWQDPPLHSLFLFCICHIIHYILCLFGWQRTRCSWYRTPIIVWELRAGVWTNCEGEKAPPQIVLVLGQKALLGVQKMSRQGAND